MSKPAFKMPERKSVDDWVAGGGASSPAAVQASQPAPEARPEVRPKAKMARLTIDLEATLHARFKAVCALDGTDMVSEVRGFIQERTQKHDKL